MLLLNLFWRQLFSDFLSLQYVKLYFEETTNCNVFLTLQDSSHGSMYFTLQLTNYSNPTYTLNSTESLTCAPKFGQTLVSRCNFQFVTHISFEKYTCCDKQRNH